MGRGQAGVPYGGGGGVGDSGLGVGPQVIMQGRTHHHGRAVDGPSLSRFSKGGEGGSTFDESLGLDLHLSLAPAGP